MEILLRYIVIKKVADEMIRIWNTEKGKWRVINTKSWKLAEIREMSEYNKFNDKKAYEVVAISEGKTLDSLIPTMSEARKIAYDFVKKILKDEFLKDDIFENGESLSYLVIE